MKLFNFLKKEDTNKKLKLQYLANLFLVAKSDGIVSKEEEDKVDEIRKSIGITKDEYEKLTKSILSGNFGSKNFVSPKSDEEAWNQLIECVNLITIDGKIDNAEIQTCKDLAKAMGYNESDIDELLPKEVLKSFNDSKKIKFNNQTLRTAIEDWLEYPISAEATYGHISGWDTSKVTDMSKLFLDAHTFNEPLNNWDVSNVTNMHAMFDNAYAFNQPLNNWDVGNVTDMSEMFSSMEALAFNQPIGNWDVRNVTDMSGMFSDAKAFNQPIGDWNVSNVTLMDVMFNGADNFNQPIGNWDVSGVTDMSNMFSETINFNQNINNWNVSNVTNMNAMFFEAKAFNQPVGKWNVSNVKNMSQMFNQAEVFNQDINNWDTSNLTNMKAMFANAKSFNSPIGNFNVSNVTSMYGLFYGAEAFNQPIDNWDVSGVTDMKGIFKDANTFKQSLENWNLTFQANLDMGDVKRIQKEYQAAITYYTKAIEIEPKNALGYKKRAEVKQFTENFKGAVADLTTAIELNPNNPDSYELRGLFKEELREFEGAILDYKKAIELEHDTKKIDLYNFNIKTVISKMEGKDEIEILREQLIKKGIDPDAEIDLKGIAALLRLNEKAINKTNEQLTDVQKIELHNNLKDDNPFKEIAGREEIKVNWLQGIGPIYSWSDEEVFKPNSLFHKPKTDNDGEFIWILCDSIEEAKMIINHILVLNVVKNAYDKIERDGWEHYFNGDLFNLGYRIPEPDDQRILVEINRHEKIDKKNKQLNNRNSSNEVSEHSSSRRFASGWTVNELKAAYWFEQSIFTAYPETNEKEDYRQRVIIEFIQMAFKNIYNIETIIENKDWTLFSLNLLDTKNYDLEESLSLLMEMDERKRLELLFIFYQLVSLSNQLIENSYENESEIELITSEFHNLYSRIENGLQVKLTEEEYHNIYEKYCEEDDRQNRDN